jgi:hypothetical protein
VVQHLEALPHSEVTSRLVGRALVGGSTLLIARCDLGGPADRNLGFRPPSTLQHLLTSGPAGLGHSGGWLTPDSQARVQGGPVFAMLAISYGAATDLPSCRPLPAKLNDYGHAGTAKLHWIGRRLGSRR